MVEASVILDGRARAVLRILCLCAAADRTAPAPLAKAR